MNKTMKRIAVFIVILFVSLLSSVHSSVGEEWTSKSACVQNFKEEGNFFTGKTYSSFREFSNVSIETAFDMVLSAIASQGFQIVNSNKALGLISASNAVIHGRGSTVPLTVFIRSAGKNVRIELTVRITGGLVAAGIDNTFCAIYSSIEDQPKNMQAQPVGKNAEQGVAPQSATVSSELMIVNKSGVKLRTKPSSKATVVKDMKKGEEVQIVKQKDEWYLIELVGGDTGWCLKGSLEKKKTLEEMRQEIEKEKAALEAKKSTTVAVAVIRPNDSRFIDEGNGTVTDTKTGLMWAAKDNGSDINWANAKSYCENYRGGGYTDWRMPTQDDLAGLYDAERAKPVACDKLYTIRVATDMIDITCFYLWASETRVRLYLIPDAAYFYFSYGERYWGHQSDAYWKRALPVRSGK